MCLFLLGLLACSVLWVVNNCSPSSETAHVHCLVTLYTGMTRRKISKTSIKWNRIFLGRFYFVDMEPLEILHLGRIISQHLVLGCELEFGAEKWPGKMWKKICRDNSWSDKDVNSVNGCINKSHWSLASPRLPITTPCREFLSFIQAFLHLHHCNQRNQAVRNKVHLIFLK